MYLIGGDFLILAILIFDAARESSARVETALFEFQLYILGSFFLMAAQIKK
jgi:hypothetical protein